MSAMKAFLCGCLLLVLLPAPTAHAQLLTDPASTHLAPGLSGRAGLFELDYDVPEGYAISGLETAETSDRPCRVGILRKGLPGHDDAYYNYDYGIYGNQQLNQGCPPSFLPTDWIPSRKRAGFFERDNLYVNAAEVCDSKNNNNERIKGIRVFASRITEDGTVQIVQEQDEFARNNCGTWQDRVTCPADEVATGIIAHFDDDGFVGLQLRCSRLLSPGGHAATPAPPAASFDWVNAYARCKAEACSRPQLASLDDAWDDLRHEPVLTEVTGRFHAHWGDEKKKASPALLQIEQVGRQLKATVERGDASLPAKTVFRGMVSGNRLQATAEDGTHLDLQVLGQQLSGTLKPAGRAAAPQRVRLTRAW